jgi:formylglycine-generating enzyme required for sulfatase activity
MRRKYRILIAWASISLLAGLMWQISMEVRNQRAFIRSIEMVLVQGGCYEMGDPSGSGKDDEHPIHMVCVDPFYLGKEMVTVGEFRRFYAEIEYQTDAEKSEGCQVSEIMNPGIVKKYNWQNPGFPQTDSNPVVCISWNDASQYINWIRKKSPKRGMAYRLPTEGEWEFAMRNRGKAVPNKFFPDESVAFHRTANMSEWILDWYGENFYKEGDKTNPLGPSTGKFRVLRGDSPMNYPGKGTLFSRFYKAPGDSSNMVGFRLALPMTDR